MIPNTTKEEIEGLQYLKEIAIATGVSRQTVTWRNQAVPLKAFVKRLERTVRTAETFAEYQAMPKADQDTIKDVGAFVGGSLKGGRRRKEDVSNRSIVTLDIDYGTPETIGRIAEALGDVTYTIYSTHNHRPDRPRLRLIVYPDRVMTVDEYPAVSRMIASKVGIDLFDDTSYDLNRLFYWPSAAMDGEWIFYHNDREFLKVGELLGEYGPEEAWRDTVLWPRSSRETRSFDNMLRRQANPLEKKGVVGAFCRAFHIHDAILTHLSGVYKRETEDRYTYVDGSTTKGLVIYGELAFSNHGSDPAGGQCCNSFDLVRIHKFGSLDEEVDIDTPTTRRPSYTEMVQWARELPAVRADLIESHLDIDASAFDVFDAAEGTGVEAWRQELQVTDNGLVKGTYYNADWIIKHDPKLKDLVRFNEFTGVMENAIKDRPFQDEDLADIRAYLGRSYTVDFKEANVVKALYKQSKRNTYHPVRDWLDTIEWDGVPRLETLFIDLFQCEDNLYTREVPKRMMMGALNRVYEPGCKFDSVAALDGDQGIGKSTFARLLAKRWFKELTTFDRKLSMEQTAGGLLIEMSEMSATKRSEIEEQKSYISTQEIQYRVPYDKYTSVFPRQCIFIATTNLQEYLKDSTGNRRWWPITCRNKKPFDFEKFESEVDQIWGEALGLYAQGYGVVLSPEAEEIAVAEQNDKMIEDPWESMINEWLKTDAPVARYDEVDAVDFNVENMEPRTRVCVFEVYRDCLRMKGRPSKLESMSIGSVLNRNPEWEKKKAQRFGKLGVNKAWEREEIQVTV